MEMLRKLVDRGRALYHAPGSKLHKLWPAFDAGETFLLTPGETTPKKGPHVRDYLDLKRTMSLVIVALLPCLVWSIYNTGHQHFAAIAARAADAGYAVGWLQALVFGASYAPAAAQVGLFDEIVFGLDQMIPILIVSYGVGLGIEAMFAILRKHEISEGYLVSGMLIALIVPPSIPLWQLALAVAFAVVLCKEVFGGTGMNIFNVALMARAFLFFAFPAQMSGDFVWVAGNDAFQLVDGHSAPTALAVAKPEALTDAAAALAGAGYSQSDMFFGLMPGSAGETSKLCVLLGAAILILTGVGSWRVMLGGVIGLVGSAWLAAALIGADARGPLTLAPYEHLLLGGFLFGIVFMATDPVTSPETDRGKWIYGLAIGFVTILVRWVNPAYPEGTMLSILLMNAFAPAIDHFLVAANIRRRKVRLGHH
jgi:Na+-transporting NADH:ubiquinone oxidoreductase subunit B